VLQITETNIYVINLPPKFGINYALNVKDLVIHKLQHLISDYSFKPLYCNSYLSKKKKHINATLNAHVVFIRDNEIQRTQFHDLDN